jgi:hypothetical protein
VDLGNRHIESFDDPLTANTPRFFNSAKPADFMPRSTVQVYCSLRFIEAGARHNRDIGIMREDRHRGSGRPLTPATPPCERVRTRRFERLRRYSSTSEGSPSDWK